MYKIILTLLIVGGTSAMAQTPGLDELRRSGIRLHPGLFEEAPNECREKVCTFYVRGAITAQTTRAVEKFIESIPNGHINYVEFDSPGGDVHAAIALGRLIRKHGVWTQTLAGECSSACVLSYVAGVRRIKMSTTPRFGIHTPYSSTTRAVSDEAAQKQYQELGGLIRTYLREMNIPEALYDEMLRYPSEGMHYLTKDEITRMRVTGTDPAYQDQVDSAHARRLGLDKRTYLSRKAQVKEQCSKYFGDYSIKYGTLRYIQCEESILKAAN